MLVINLLKHAYKGNIIHNMLTLNSQSKIINHANSNSNPSQINTHIKKTPPNNQEAIPGDNPLMLLQGIRKKCVKNTIII